MQFATVIALLVAGAIASPSKPAKPEKPKVDIDINKIQVTTANCSGGTPYCCNFSQERFNLSKNTFLCSKLENGCNNIVVCCNNVVGENGAAEQTCGALGNAQVIFKND